MVWLAPFKTFELKDVLVEGRFEMCTGLLRAPESALVTVRNGEEDDIVQLRVPELAQLHTSLNARQHEGQWHGEGVNAGIYNSRLSRHATKGICGTVKCQREERVVRNRGLLPAGVIQWFSKHVDDELFE